MVRSETKWNKASGKILARLISYIWFTKSKILQGKSLSGLIVGKKTCKIQSQHLAALCIVGEETNVSFTQQGRCRDYLDGRRFENGRFARFALWDCALKDLAPAVLAAAGVLNHPTLVDCVPRHSHDRLRSQPHFASCCKNTQSYFG